LGCEAFRRAILTPWVERVEIVRHLDLPF
jgi:hypothetical protein